MVITVIKKRIEQVIVITYWSEMVFIVPFQCQTPVTVMLSLVPLIKVDTHSVLSSLLMEGGLHAIDIISAHVSDMCFSKHAYYRLFSLA